MQPYRLWLCLALVRADVSEELISSIIRMQRISELGTTLTVASMLVVPSSHIFSTLMMEAIRHNPEDGILHSLRRETLKFYFQ
jgi:hypothetical protein